MRKTTALRSACPSPRYLRANPCLHALSLRTRRITSRCLLNARLRSPQRTMRPRSARFPRRTDTQEHRVCPKRNQALKSRRTASSREVCCDNLDMHCHWLTDSFTSLLKECKVKRMPPLQSQELIFTLNIWCTTACPYLCSFSSKRGRFQDSAMINVARGTRFYI